MLNTILFAEIVQVFFVTAFLATLAAAGFWQIRSAGWHAGFAAGRQSVLNEIEEQRKIRAAATHTE